MPIYVQIYYPPPRKTRKLLKINTFICNQTFVKKVLSIKIDKQ